MQGPAPTRHSLGMGAPAAVATQALRTFWFRAAGYSAGAMSEEAALGRDEVLQRVRARVLASARRFVSPTDAEDLAQDTLLLLSTKYAHVEAADELVRIAVAIVSRKLQGLWRKRARRARLGDTPLPGGEDGEADPLGQARSESPDPEQVAVDRQRVALLVDAVARLGSNCRELLYRKVEGASLKEIAVEMRRPVNTIYSWDHRCHKRLRGLLGERWAFVAGVAPGPGPRGQEEAP